jgi:hypothetical protein
MSRHRGPAIRVVVAAALLFASVMPGVAVPAAQAAAPPVVSPASNLLPGGTTSLAITATTDGTANCRWGTDTAAGYETLTPFGAGDGTATHTTTVPIDPDPARLSAITVRCNDAPTLATTVIYRDLPTAEPGWPRIGNLWGSWNFENASDAELARVDLWLGADFSDARAAHVRALNPAVRILSDYNFVEWGSTPPAGFAAEEFYLEDAAHHRVEVWPGAYRVNLTRPAVAAFMADQAYQGLVKANLRFDGIFVDNVFMSQSWQDADIYGTPFHPDADGNGQPDNLATFDAQWRQGALAELARLRALMPNAILMNHAVDIDDAEVAAAFNGTSIGFDVPEAKEQREIWSGHVMTYAEADARYAGWLAADGPAASPRYTMVESAVPTEMGYGYGYDPLDGAIPASTLRFARDDYAYMRFGYGFTLMRDGYFAHEFGDTWHGNRWWYDEMLFDLGAPKGEARLALSVAPGVDLVSGGTFEGVAPLAGWGSWVDATSGYRATFAAASDASAPEGSGVLRIDVTAAGADSWRVSLEQSNRRLVKGTTYELSFWARADTARRLGLEIQKGAPDWRDYGLSQDVDLGTAWKQYRVRFTATATAADARLGFFVGDQTGTVWLDGLHLRAAAPDVWRRDFRNGLVILNATAKTVTVRVGAGFHRLKGSQAPRDQRIVDDTSGSITFTGTWKATRADSGLWKATRPWYHDWGAGMHLATGRKASTARWALRIPTADRYTVSAWWAAAPAAKSTWARRAVFEVVSGGRVVARRTLDQRSGGDQWHAIASKVRLAPGAYVRLRCAAGQRCAADAILLASAHRYNDGSAVSRVTLAPFDAAVLRRDVPLP